MFQLVCVHLTSCLLMLASSLKRLARESTQYTGWFLYFFYYFLLFFFFCFKLLIKFYLKQKNLMGLLFISDYLWTPHALQKLFLFIHSFIWKSFPQKKSSIEHHDLKKKVMDKWELFSWGGPALVLAFTLSTAHVVSNLSPMETGPCSQDQPEQPSNCLWSAPTIGK